MSTPITQISGNNNFPEVPSLENVELPDNNTVSDTLNNTFQADNQEVAEETNEIKELPNTEAVASLNLIGSYQKHLLNNALPPKPQAQPRPQQHKEATVPTIIAKAPKHFESPFAKPEKKAVSPEATKVADTKPSTQPTTTAPVKPQGPIISQEEAGNFVRKFGGNTEQLGKELSFKLISPKPEDRDLVRAALTYVSNTDSPQAASKLAKETIKNIPADGIFKAIANTTEGARSLNLIRSYLNINNSENGNEIARLNKALSPSTSNAEKTSGTQGLSKGTQVIEPKIIATKGNNTLTLKSVSRDYKQLTPEKFLTGDTNSLAAIVIGNSEGNRTPRGGIVEGKYNGHIDPGNGAYNVGSFSKQGFPRGTNPEVADKAQIKEFEKKIPEYTATAKKAGLDPNNPILLANYLDLYNQASPSKAERFLKQFPIIGKEGVSNESILRARVNSFYDDKGNETFSKKAFGNAEGLKFDQIRRMNALTDTLKLNGYISTIDKPVNAGSIKETQRSLSTQNGSAKYIIKDSSVILSDRAKVKLDAISKTYFEKTGKTLVITDGNRTPHDQAERLYDKIQSGGDYIYKQKQLLAEVRQAYFAGKKEGKSRNEIVSDITNVVQKQVDRKKYISLHLLGGATDISVRGLNRDALTAAGIAAGIDEKSIVDEGNHIHIQF